MKDQEPSLKSENIAPKPEKYHWKRSYTVVLVANAIYILFFYFLMTLFT